jgi:hypothetical protein
MSSVLGQSKSHGETFSQSRQTALPKYQPASFVYHRTPAPEEGCAGLSDDLQQVDQLTIGFTT